MSWAKYAQKTKKYTYLRKTKCMAILFKIVKFMVTGSGVWALGRG